MINYQDKIYEVIACIAEKINKETLSYAYDKIKKVLFIHFYKIEKVIEFKKNKINFEGQELRMSNTIEFNKNTIKITIPTYIGKSYQSLIDSVKEQIAPKGRIINMIMWETNSGVKLTDDVKILMELEHEKTLPAFLDIRDAKYSLIYQGAPRSCNYCKTDRHHTGECPVITEKNQKKLLKNIKFKKMEKNINTEKGAKINKTTTNTFMFAAESIKKRKVTQSNKDDINFTEWDIEDILALPIQYKSVLPDLKINQTKYNRLAEANIFTIKDIIANSTTHIIGKSTVQIFKSNNTVKIFRIPSYINDKITRNKGKLNSEYLSSKRCIMAGKPIKEFTPKDARKYKLDLLKEISVNCTDWILEDKNKKALPT
ncbi:hypothetical protein BB561_001876 [Smittium simulii]|uniref:Uncharacterized protein n=1 Tax=Smittium simulii TaxID=133385 RepID=A0A2T9YSK1_9FUNG|nr:hypothetical protein BB561_001876 [Smittium simulii]